MAYIMRIDASKFYLVRFSTRHDYGRTANVNSIASATWLGSLGELPNENL